MLTMLIMGTCNTIVMKAQDQVVVKKGPDIDDKGNLVKHKFTHPYFQCANMFVGELCCLLVYFAKKSLTKKKVEGEDVTPLSPGGQMAKETKLKTNINPILLAIPASCDICGSTLMFVALTQCAASVY